MGKVVNKMAFNIKCEKVKNVTNEEDVTRIKAKEEEILAAEKELKIKIERDRIIESNLRSLLESRLELDFKTKAFTNKKIKEKINNKSDEVTRSKVRQIEATQRLILEKKLKYDMMAKKEEKETQTCMKEAIQFQTKQIIK